MSSSLTKWELSPAHKGRFCSTLTMNNESKTDLESDKSQVQSCCSSGTPIQNVVKSSEDILSNELWSDWEEIFARLDQQDGVRDGQILRFLKNIDPVINCCMQRILSKKSCRPVSFCHSMSSGQGLPSLLAGDPQPPRHDQVGDDASTQPCCLDHTSSCISRIWLSSMQSC